MSRHLRRLSPRVTLAGKNPANILEFMVVLTDSGNWAPVLVGNPPQEGELEFETPAEWDAVVDVLAIRPIGRLRPFKDAPTPPPPPPPPDDD